MTAFVLYFLIFYLFDRETQEREHKQEEGQREE